MSRAGVTPGTAASRGVSWLSRNVTRRSGCGYSPSRRSASAERRGRRLAREDPAAAAWYSGKSKTVSTPGSIPSQPARPPWKKLRSAGVDDPRLADDPHGGMGRLEPPAPVPPEGAVDHRVRIEPDAVGLEQRGPPERLLDRIAARAGVAQVEVGQDAGEPAVGHAPVGRPRGRGGWSAPRSGRCRRGGRSSGPWNQSSVGGWTTHRCFGPVWPRTWSWITFRPSRWASSTSAR